MITFKSESGQTYNAEDYGHILLIEDGEPDCPLTDIAWDD
jgi:hypothetical protein